MLLLGSGPDCTEINERYLIRIPPAQTPDFIRKDVNQPGYEVLQDPGMLTYGITIPFAKTGYPLLQQPQQNLYVFCGQYIQPAILEFEWDVSPSGAGSMVDNNFKKPE